MDTSADRRTQPPPRHGSREPQGRRVSAPLITIALLLISIGYGLTLTPDATALGLPALALAGVLLLVGLNQSVREELDAES